MSAAGIASATNETEERKCCVCERPAVRSGGVVDSEISVVQADEEPAVTLAMRQTRRRERAAKPPEERIAGRLQFWVLGRRAKRHEPTEAEVAARRAELLAELAARDQGPAPRWSPGAVGAPG